MGCCDEVGFAVFCEGETGGFVGVFDGGGAFVGGGFVGGSGKEVKERCKYKTKYRRKITQMEKEFRSSLKPQKH